MSSKEALTTAGTKECKSEPADRYVDSILGEGIYKDVVEHQYSNNTGWGYGCVDATFDSFSQEYELAFPGAQ